MVAVQQKNAVQWRVAGKSDVGSVRGVNEDSLLCEASLAGVVAVADGVGGLEHGERASAAATALVREFFAGTRVPAAERPDFFALFRKIDAAVEKLGDALVPGFGIATTLDVAVAGEGGRIHFAHLGDSGIFLLRGNAFERLSEEHTLAAEERARGNADFPAAYENTLTRALGIGAGAEPQVFTLDARAGDRILLATDGITRMISREAMREIVGVPAASPEEVAAELIRAANAAGGFDNATAALIFV